MNLFRPSSKDMKLKPASFAKIVEFFDWVHNNHKIISLSDPLFSSIFTDSYVKVDPSGESSLRITQEGNIYPSTYLLTENFIMGNITEINTLTEIMDSEIINLIKKIKIPEECRLCKNCDRCKGGTLDRRFLWNKTFDIKDPYCPKNYGLPSTLRRFTIDDTEFSSVHDGYLPTLFFKAV